MRFSKFSQKKGHTGSLKQVVSRQYQSKADSALSVRAPAVPPEGWIRTIRKALGMSGAQLAARLGISRNRVSVLERKEAEGSISLKQLKELASELDADLVYAIVPKQSVADSIDKRAEALAQARLNTTHQNMMLESQQISSEKRNEALLEAKVAIKNAGGKSLWNIATSNK